MQILDYFNVNSFYNVHLFVLCEVTKIPRNLAQCLYILKSSHCPFSEQSTGNLLTVTWFPTVLLERVRRDAAAFPTGSKDWTRHCMRAGLWGLSGCLLFWKAVLIKEAYAGPTCSKLQAQVARLRLIQSSGLRLSPYPVWTTPSHLPHPPYTSLHLRDVFFCSLLHLQHLAQCLTHSRYSLNMLSTGFCLCQSE